MGPETQCIKDENGDISFLQQLVKHVCRGGRVSETVFGNPRELNLPEADC
jgi:hypothetical protein